MLFADLKKHLTAEAAAVHCMKSLKEHDITVGGTQSILFFLKRNFQLNKL